MCNTSILQSSLCVCQLSIVRSQVPQSFLACIKIFGSLGMRLVLMHCIVEPLCFGHFWNSLIKGGVLISCVALRTSYIKGGILISWVVLYISCVI